MVRAAPLLTPHVTASGSTRLSSPMDGYRYGSSCVDERDLFVPSFGNHKGALVKFVGIREFRANAAKVVESLKEQNEIVITSNGRPVAVLTPTDEERLEEDLSALRTARAVQAVTALQHRSVQMGTDRVPEEKIDAEIRAARSDLKR